MKKWILASLVVLSLAGVSPASLIAISGSFDNSSATFTYDGQTFQDTWAIRLYQSAVADFTFTASLFNTQLHQTSVSVVNSFPLTYVAIVPQSNLSFTDNSYVYSVLFDTATPTAGSGNYLLLDTLARNVGAYNAPNPNGAYTPGSSIPYSGSGIVQFNGQEWQPMGNPIPEPATMGLLGLGALALVLRRKMRN